MKDWENLIKDTILILYNFLHYSSLYKIFLFFILFYFFIVFLSALLINMQQEKSNFHNFLYIRFFLHTLIRFSIFAICFKHIF